MRIPKRYGQSRVDRCPFCDKLSVTKNPQDVPVCMQHKSMNLTNLKCICGEWLDVQSGKYGAYFRCMNCGNVNFQKALELNPQIKSKTSAIEQKDRLVKENTSFVERNQRVVEKKEFMPSLKSGMKKEIKETIIRSDDPNYF